MAMNFPKAPANYDQFNEQAFRKMVVDELSKMFRRGAHLELGPDAGLNFTSPNGTRYRLTVDDAGAAVWTLL